MSATRTIIIAGAGIGGLAAALALARRGFPITVLEQAERLEETGAGLQLSPNASRALLDLGLRDLLQPHVVAPSALRVLRAADGRELTRMPLGTIAEQRFGAPYWVIHRGDLQAALLGALGGCTDVTLKLGMRVEDFAAHSQGVTVSARGQNGTSADERGCALIAADGLWSNARVRLGYSDPPRFAGRTAWRALLRASEVAPDFREPLIHLWLAPDAHLVHYPIKGGSVVNVVAILPDRWDQAGWSEPAGRTEMLARFPHRLWASQARALLAAPDAWLKWALFRRRPLLRWSRGPITLLGDAAHPALPFIAQGAAMAIEDAVVVAHCLARTPEDVAGALRSYERMRRRRTRRVQRAAARTGMLYHLRGAPAELRDLGMRALGAGHLLRHYEWLYAWRPPPEPSSSLH